MAPRSTSTSSTELTDSQTPADLPEVGRTGRPHGVRGDLYVSLITDRVERVAPGSRLRVGSVWHTVESSRPAGQRWLVHFAGIDDRSVAERLVNQRLFAEPLADRGDGLYVDQLIGREVVGVDGRSFGRCVAVVDNPAHDILELEGGGLVPIVFVTDIVDGRIIIDPPEGLLD